VGVDRSGNLPVCPFLFGETADSPKILPDLTPFLQKRLILRVSDGQFLSTPGDFLL
jgi:hypothetical protein